MWLSPDDEFMAEAKMFSDIVSWLYNATRDR